MEREIIITSDGSTTIHLPGWNEQYHSKHGAIQEAYHVFLHAGFFKIDSELDRNFRNRVWNGIECFDNFFRSEKAQQKSTVCGGRSLSHFFRRSAETELCFRIKCE